LVATGLVDDGLGYCDPVDESGESIKDFGELAKLLLAAVRSNSIAGVGSHRRNRLLLE
jgi:hypothetical protein